VPVTPDLESRGRRQAHYLEKLLALTEEWASALHYRITLSATLRLRRGAWQSCPIKADLVEGSLAPQIRFNETAVSPDGLSMTFAADSTPRAD
jgi:hypothetical protein